MKNEESQTPFPKMALQSCFTFCILRLLCTSGVGGGGRGTTFCVLRVLCTSAGGGVGRGTTFCVLRVLCTSGGEGVGRGRGETTKVKP